MNSVNEGSLQGLMASRSASDERLRASLRRLNDVARRRLARSRENVSKTGHELIRDFVGAEVWVVVALAFGMGVLLGRRRA